MSLALIRQIIPLIRNLIDFIAGLSGGLFAQVIALLFVYLIFKFGIDLIEKIITGCAKLMEKFE